MFCWLDWSTLLWIIMLDLVWSLFIQLLVQQCPFVPWYICLVCIAKHQKSLESIESSATSYFFLTKIEPSQILCIMRKKNAHSHWVENLTPASNLTIVLMYSIFLLHEIKATFIIFTLVNLRVNCNIPFYL